jgi:hypothetical protein
MFLRVVLLAYALLWVVTALCITEFCSGVKVTDALC